MHFSKCVLAFMASTAVMAAPAPIDDYSVAIRKSIDANAPEQVETLLAQRDEDLVARGFLDPLINVVTKRLDSIIGDMSDTAKDLASASNAGKAKIVQDAQAEVYQLEAGVAIMKILNSASGKAALSSSQSTSIKQAVTAVLTQLRLIDQKSLNTFQQNQLKSVITILENFAKAFGIALPTTTKAYSSSSSTSSRSSSSTKSSTTTSKSKSSTSTTLSSTASSSVDLPFTPKIPVPVSTSFTSTTTTTTASSTTSTTAAPSTTSPTMTSAQSSSTSFSSSYSTITTLSTVSSASTSSDSTLSSTTSITDTPTSTMS